MEHGPFIDNLPTKDGDFLRDVELPEGPCHGNSGYFMDFPMVFQEWDLPRPSRSVTPPPQRGPKDEKAGSGLRNVESGTSPNGGCLTKSWAYPGLRRILLIIIIKMDDLGVS